MKSKYKFKVGDTVTFTDEKYKEHVGRIILVSKDSDMLPYLCSFGRKNSTASIHRAWVLRKGTYLYVPKSVACTHCGEYVRWVPECMLEKENKNAKRGANSMVEARQIEQQRELVELEAKNLSNNIANGLVYNFSECPRNCTRTALQNQIVVLRYHLGELKKLIEDWNPYSEDD